MQYKPRGCENAVRKLSGQGFHGILTAIFLFSHRFAKTNIHSLFSVFSLIIHNIGSYNEQYKHGITHIRLETKMKRITLSILVIFAVALTACSALSNSTSSNSAQTGNELTAIQLATGTLKLEGTEQAVTAEQAKELVTYWYVYNEISQSDTSAQEEIDGLVSQIQESMTSEQLQAISDMQITQQDATVLQGSTTSKSSKSNGNISSSGGAPSDGGMPADTGGTDQMTGAGQQPAAQAATSGGSSQKTSSALIETLIESLEQKLA
jgi:hypothetical protein